MRYVHHCQRSSQLLGEEFGHVHKWLDELAHTITEQGQRSFDQYHRKHRHNHEGILHVFRIWGPAAAEAAKLHILDDLFGAGEHTKQQESDIPLDEKDYVRKGWI